MMLSLLLGSILSEVRRGVVELPGCVYTLSPLFFNWGTLTLTLTLTLALALALALEMALALLLLTISSTLKSLLVVFKACKMNTEREIFKSSTS